VIKFEKKALRDGYYVSNEIQGVEKLPFQIKLRKTKHFFDVMKFEKKALRDGYYVSNEIQGVKKLPFQIKLRKKFLEIPLIHESF
jgi:hypothetical protein